MAHSLCTNPSFLPSLVLFSSILCMLSFISHAGDPPLTLDYYTSSCPNALQIIRKEMECAVFSEPRMAASILRLHMHDCFVQGCDGSILLDDTITLEGEKGASTNSHSLRGFMLIDRIKNKLESECPGIVSCADLLTVAARDAVILVGGPYWHVPLGRKDSTTASPILAIQNLPTANQGLLSLISSFFYQGLSVTDLVALTGAHTIGMARCENFRERIYGSYGITSEKDLLSKARLDEIKSVCPATGGGNDNTTAMDYVTPNLFDNSFYHLLLKGEGVLYSDQELYSSMFAIQTKKLVQKYADDVFAFFQQFSESMVKLGNITNDDSFVTGEVRQNCRFVNT